jgi:hypothetical protein
MSMSKGGPVPQLRQSSVSPAASDRTDAAIAKPETQFVRVDELGDQISGNAWRAFRACPAKAVKIPVLADAGAGFGEPLHTMHRA